MVAGTCAFGVIPARGGSKGLPGKNLKHLGPLSLIGHAVASAREARALTRVIVSTDSEAIAEEARRHGAEVPFLRPAALASDDTFASASSAVARRSVIAFRTDWLSLARSSAGAMRPRYRGAESITAHRTGARRPG